MEVDEIENAMKLNVKKIMKTQQGSMIINENHAKRQWEILRSYKDNCKSIEFDANQINKRIHTNL